MHGTMHRYLRYTVVQHSLCVDVLELMYRRKWVPLLYVL